MTNKALPYMDLFREKLGSLVDYLGPMECREGPIRDAQILQPGLNR